MAYDTLLADRVEQILNEQRVPFETKKMFGGLCYMVDSKMCFGVEKERLMLRLNPDSYDDYMLKPGAKPMDFTGKPMKGYVFLYAEGYDLDEHLSYWIGEALAFNPLAKASKKRKPKKL